MQSPLFSAALQTRLQHAVCHCTYADLLFYTVYFAVLLLLPHNPMGANNPSLAQKTQNDPHLAWLLYDDSPMFYCRQVAMHGV